MKRAYDLSNLIHLDSGYACIVSISEIYERYKGALILNAPLLFSKILFLWYIVE